MARFMTNYNGARMDVLTGQQYLGNGYRGYSPALFRFTSHDDWSPFNTGGPNGYTYCDGDPVNRDDPSGHVSWQSGLGIGLGVLGILGTLFTAGASLAATGCLSVGLAAASGGALVADVTGIISGATPDSSPKVSSALGWLSLATGILSVSLGLGPIIGKLNQELGGWLQGSLCFLNKIERRGRCTGIPLSGEFSRPQFLGRHFYNGHMQWSFRYEDTVPLGRRLNIVMGSEVRGTVTHAISEVMNGGQWFPQRYTATGLRDFAVRGVGDFNVYRLVMPNSGVYAGRGGAAMAALFYNRLANESIVAGFHGAPQWGGPVAALLQRSFTLAEQLGETRIGHLFNDISAQHVLDGLARTYGDTALSLMFDGEITIFPANRRGFYEDENFY